MYATCMPYICLYVHILLTYASMCMPYICMPMNACIVFVCLYMYVLSINQCTSIKNLSRFVLILVYFNLQELCNLQVFLCRYVHITYQINIRQMYNKTILKRVRSLHSHIVSDSTITKQLWSDGRALLTNLPIISLLAIFITLIRYQTLSFAMLHTRSKLSGLGAAYSSHHHHNKTPFIHAVAEQ